MVNDVEEHVSCVLGVPSLADYGDVELSSLQKANCLPNEDVGQALALHGDLNVKRIGREKWTNLLLIADLGGTICWVGSRRID